VSTITTRPASRTADPSYESVSPEEFRARTARGRWLINDQLSGAVAYGTSIDEIEAMASAGRVSVHSIYAAPPGAGRLREVFGRRVFSLGLLAADGGVEAQLAVLRGRLLERGREDPATIEAKLRHQVEPLTYVLENPVIATADGPLPAFDRVLVNESLPAAVARVLELFDQACGVPPAATRPSP
jgi:ribose 1,5-bisphosphokinase PhnN